MSGASLSASIFGSGDKPAEKNSSLSSLFGNSSELPHKPNNLNFTEPEGDRKKREQKEEKKKKRKPKKEAGDVDGDEAKKTEGEEDKDDSPSKEDEERTVFVGGLPTGITRKSLASIFKSCGIVKSSRIRSIATAGVKVASEHKGNQKLVKKISVNTSKLLADAPKKNAQGYVVFEEVESVDKALEMNNTPVPGSDGLMFRVDAANPTHDSTRSVFVGNLPYKTDEMSLRDHFKSGCGFEDDVIENVRVIRDSETSQCKGFGYILLKDKSYLPYVLDMHESTYKKKELRVMVCGKRFKGRRGAKKEKKEVDGAMKRIKDKYKKTTAESLAGNKEKRKRGTKKVGARKATGQAGISKRAATDKKVDKRVKKIQKRLTTGMGKGKK